MSVELSEPFLANIAGWEAMKSARALLASGKVLSSNYTPPILKGVVQEGTTSYRAGLVLKSGIDLENLCTCRASRDWGTICAHSVAVGLHHLKPPSAVADVSGKFGERTSATSAGTIRETQRLRRATPNDLDAELLEVHVILPPNFAEAAAKGKVMLVLEGQRDAGGTSARTPSRVPLNAVSKEQPFRLSEADEKFLNRIEELAGEPVGMLVITTRAFVELLPALAEHPRVTLGKATSVHVAHEPWLPPLCATLEPNGEITLTLQRSVIGPVLIETSWVFANNTLRPLGLSRGLLSVLQSPLRVKRMDVPGFLNTDWPRLVAQQTREVIPVAARGNSPHTSKRISRSMISLSRRKRRTSFSISPVAWLN